MKEYTRLEYIESDGNQWIDTGVKAGYKGRVLIDFAYTKTTPVQQRIFGATVDNGDSSLFCFDSFINGHGHYSWACQDGTGNFTSTFKTATTDRVLLDIDGYKGVVTMSGAVTYSAAMNTSRTKTGTNNIYLMSTNQNGSGIVSSKNAFAKLYSCKIYEEGSIVREYIPVKNSEGICGLYDQVEKKFYASQGSSAFIGGAEIEDKPLSFPYGFRRRCLLILKKGQHISEGLDFWFDGLDNQANGVYNQSAKTWYPKSDNANVSSGYFNLIGTSAFLSGGGVSVHPTSSGDRACGAVDYNSQSPFYRLDKTYNSTIGFTIETIVDIEKTNPYSTGEEWFWGITYNNNSGASYRGGFLMEGDVIKYRFYNPSYGWQSYSFGIQKIFGKQILTLVLDKNNTLNLYLNGGKVSSVDMPSGFKIPNTSYNPITFGGYNSIGTHAIYGTFYSFKAYGRVLSDREIMDSANFAKSYYKL